MSSVYTLIPNSTLTLGVINTWNDGTIIINNGSSVKLDLSNLIYRFDENLISDIRIIKVGVIWPTGEIDSYNTKLTDNDSLSWLKTIGPKHIVFEESALINDNKNKQININLYDIADNKYQLQIPIRIESRSILDMNITVEPSFAVYNGNISAAILDIRPESAVSSFPDYKTPVLMILT